MNWLLNFFIFDAIFTAAASLDEGIVNWIHSFGSLNQHVETMHGLNRPWFKDVHSRRKRSLMNFHNVIQCAQPWANNVLSTYGDYGCYCGYSGEGRPLDDTDQCCYLHDRCYDEAETITKTFSERTGGSYFADYSYECKENRPICIENENTVYTQAICNCDRIASECFLAARRTYNRGMFNLNTNKYCTENADLSDLRFNVHLLSKLYTCPMELNQDRCCVDKGYNSAYETCCDGRVRKKPENARDIACCGRRVYDTERKSCCAGRLHRNLPHKQCCYNGVVVDTRRQHCPALNTSSNATVY
nr:uncharacterized protein LOC113474129 [Ciona intestinalis]|eukprot:XP_026689661.1 uncharacterized protein LOC113474129 [Ciona intestinalis]